MVNINLKTIAEKLGVSISTVSRALRNHPDVNAHTKEAVIELAEQLDYYPNHLAHQMLKGRSNLIGVVLPKIQYPLYAQALTGIESVAEARGYQILLCQSNEKFETEVRQVTSLLSSRVSGLIISLSSTTHTFAHLEKVKKRNVPLVLFNRDCLELNCSRVTIDNRRVAFEAVRYLIDQGCRKIAFIGGPSMLQVSHLRQQGYEDALRLFSSDSESSYKRIIEVEFDRESIDLGILRLFNGLPHAMGQNWTGDQTAGEGQPDAILTYSDQIAQRVLFQAKKLGIQIPKELKVIGFNNEPVNELLEPSLSSVAQPAREMGKVAADLVFKELEEEKFSYEKIVLGSQLVLRGST